CGLTPHRIMGRLVKAFQIGAPAGYELVDAETWTPDQVEERRRLVVELSERLRSVGPLLAHPWRGGRRDAPDPADLEGLDRLMEALQAHVSEAPNAARSATELLGMPAPQTLADLDAAVAWLRAAADLPRGFDNTALAHPAWLDRASDLTTLVEL